MQIPLLGTGAAWRASVATPGVLASRHAGGTRRPHQQVSNARRSLINCLTHPSCLRIDGGVDAALTRTPSSALLLSGKKFLHPGNFMGSIPIPESPGGGSETRERARAAVSAALLKVRALIPPTFVHAFLVCFWASRVHLRQLLFRKRCHLLPTPVTQVVGQKLEDGDSLMSNGVDSLSAVEVASAINEELGLELPETLAFDYPTLGDVVQYVAGQLACKGN